MAEKKLTKDDMEHYFSGQSTNGMNKSGDENFTSEKFTLKARPDSSSEKGEEFKGSKEKSA